MTDYIMKTYNRKPVTFVRGEGVYLWDDKGKKYLDALCGLAVTSLGHSNKQISEALSIQSQNLIHTSNAFNIAPQEELAHKLCKVSGMTNAFFCNSGAEAVETAIKIARKYGNYKKIKSPKIIVMENSFHGRTLAALSATSNKKSHQGFFPLVDGFLRAQYDSIDSVRELLDNNDNDVVAILLEPVQGEGGIQIPQTGFLRDLRDICNHHDLLLMVDEVQTGFCRTGKWFGYQHEEVIPDVVMVAKALGNGVPIGVCLASGEASKLLEPGSHGSTFGGNFLSTIAGLTVLSIMRDQNICKNVREIGSYFNSMLQKTIEPKKNVSEIRCKGLMIGVELKNECNDIVIKALEKGLVLNITKDKVIRMLPPLILEKSHVEKIVRILDEII